MLTSWIAKDFISKLLEKSPEKRYTAEQACNHPWLQVGNSFFEFSKKFRVMLQARSSHVWILSEHFSAITTNNGNEIILTVKVLTRRSSFLRMGWWVHPWTNDNSTVHYSSIPKFSSILDVEAFRFLFSLLYYLCGLNLHDHFFAVQLCGSGTIQQHFLSNILQSNSKFLSQLLQSLLFACNYFLIFLYCQCVFRIWVLTGWVVVVLFAHLFDCLSKFYIWSNEMPQGVLSVLYL